MAEEKPRREIVLHMAEPSHEFGEVRYAEILVNQRFLVVTSSGTIESTGQIVALLREVADELEADACGG
jgi:hypothetical protein